MARFAAIRARLSASWVSAAARTGSSSSEKFSAIAHDSAEINMVK